MLGTGSILKIFVIRQLERRDGRLIALYVTVSHLCLSMALFHSFGMAIGPCVSDPAAADSSDLSISFIPLYSSPSYRPKLVEEMLYFGLPTVFLR